MVCYIDCNSTYLSKAKSDVYTIIQTLAITRSLLITFLCYTITVKEKNKVMGPNVRPRVQTGLITVIYSNSAFYTSD